MFSANFIIGLIVLILVVGVIIPQGVIFWIERQRTKGKN